MIIIFLLHMRDATRNRLLLQKEREIRNKHQLWFSFVDLGVSTLTSTCTLYLLLLFITPFFLFCFYYSRFFPP